MVTPAVLSLCHLRTALKYRDYERGRNLQPKSKRVCIAAQMTLFFGRFFVEIDV